MRVDVAVSRAEVHIVFAGLLLLLRDGHVLSQASGSSDLQRKEPMISVSFGPRYGMPRVVGAECPMPQRGSKVGESPLALQCLRNSDPPDVNVQMTDHFRAPSSLIMHAPFPIPPAQGTCKNRDSGWLA